LAFVAIAATAVAALVLAGVGPVQAAKPASPAMQFSNTNYTASENATNASIAIQRTPSGSSTVVFRTNGGTATAGADCTNPATDYIPVAPTTVPFASQGVVSALVPICNNNSVNEANETVKLLLSDPSGASLVKNKNQATLTIVDDDPRPSLSLNDVSSVEGATAQLTVTASAVSAQPMSVTWSTANGTATAGASGDYVAQSGSVAIPPGGTTATFNVSSRQDTTDEFDETVLVNLTSPINASLGDAQGVRTIVDDDAAPVVSWSNDPSVAEGGTLSFDLALSAASGKPVTVNIGTWTGAGFATAGDDYTTVPPGDVTFNPGQTSLVGALQVTTIDDAAAEDDEKVWSQMFALTNATTLNVFDDGTIQANDAVVPVATVGADQTGTEGDTLTFTINLSAASASQVTVSVRSCSCGEASVGDSDFDELTTDVVIPAGNTSGTFDVDLLSDEDDEGQEIFWVQITGATNATVGPPFTGYGLTDDQWGQAFIDDGARSAQYGTQSGSISPAGQRDRWTIDVPAGASLHVDTIGADTSCAALDTWLYVYDTDGTTLIGNNDDVVPGLTHCSLVEVTDLAGGTYVIEVGEFADNDTGAYTLNVSIVESESESNDTFGTADAAFPDTTFAALDPAGDEDWFSVTLALGATITVETVDGTTNTCAASVATGVGDTVVSLIAPDGVTVVDSDDDAGVGACSLLTATVGAAGTYFVRVADFGDNDSYTYGLKVT
jgi:hypothetical protein